MLPLYRANRARGSDMAKLREPVADLALAESLHRQGKLLRAEKEYRRYLTTRPDDPDAITLLGVLKGEAKQNAAAIALLRKAVQIAPASAVAHYNLGRALLDEG